MSRVHPKVALGDANAARAVAVFRRAAQRGLPAPRNVDLARAIGIARRQDACRIVRRAESLGLIRVTRGGTWRIVAAADGSWRTALPAEIAAVLR